MSLTDDESSTDWLDALADDARQCEMVLNRVESLGILAIEHLRRGDIKSAIHKLAEMGEGIHLSKKLLGIK